jgi:hypothetical protein
MHDPQATLQLLDALPREEALPCSTCGDTGVVGYDAGGGQYDERNCPECNSW